MEKKDSARILFFDSYSQKEIARILDVSEQTLSKWAKEGNWDAKRAERIANQKGMQDRILKLINYQLGVMESWAAKEESDDNGDPKPLDKGQIDALSKLFSAVKSKELGWAQIVAINREVLEYLEERDIQLAKALIPHMDAFLNEKREQLDA